MRVYLCRWPNGDCSIVAARDGDAAVELLDNEIGNAEGMPLYPITSDLLINLRLREDSGFELDGDQPLSSDLRGEILRRAYPVLDEVLNSAETSATKVTRKQIAQAVREEKKRPVAAKVIAGTPEGRRLQKLANVPASKADRIARETASRKRH